MEVALKGYLVGARAAFELVSARASSDEIDALRLLTRRLIDHLADVQSVLCAAYLDELRSTSGSEQALRAGLVRALLDDDAVAVEGGALAVGVELAAEYAVVTFEVETGGGRSWSDDLEDRAVPVMARRFLRTVRGVLLDAEPEPLLRLAPSGGVVLLPQRPGSDWTGPRTRALVDRIQDATGAALRAAVATGPRGDLGAAAHLTRELVDLSTALGLPAGTYCLDQLLLEYQLSRPGPGADALRRRMLPLTEHPVMWRTLHAYVGTEHSRPRTAARLSVHPNTVDYRLSRVRDLVGLDATVPSELATLRAGLAVLGAPDPAAS
nr:PucR family transcriptional regulator [Nocardioides flavescens]